MITTDFQEILNRIDLISPVKYSADRNFIDGSVSRLSPYISRGVISTRFVFEKLMEKGYNFYSIEKFIQELCWRDYWQLIWVENGSSIDNDLKSKQKDVSDYLFSKSVNHANTGISAIDNGIDQLYSNGYMHNHLRMYVASISSNIAQSHWKNPARWMYYHLLDGDWGSNALSWQWVCGTNSNKKYYANQDNINKYCYTNQRNSFLDVDYSDFEGLSIPDQLKEKIDLKLETVLPKNQTINLDRNKSTLIYNFYNVDPIWRKNEDCNRILLLEPKIFEQYPVSEKSIDFTIELSKNINNIQVYCGSYEKLVKDYNLKDIIYKEHPLNNHYIGKDDQRDWMYYMQEMKSFFNYWKKCKKHLIRNQF